MLANYIERLMNKCLDELIRSGCIELKEAPQGVWRMPCGGCGGCFSHRAWGRNGEGTREEDGPILQVCRSSLLCLIRVIVLYGSFETVLCRILAILS